MIAFNGAGLWIKLRCTKPPGSHVGTIFLYGYCKRGGLVYPVAGGEVFVSVRGDSDVYLWY